MSCIRDVLLGIWWAVVVLTILLLLAHWGLR